jgi:murein tripeptide amidase MpaA
VEGRPVDCLRIGTGGKVCLITARQHPSETMAAWSVKGFVDRLLVADGLADRLKEAATFWIVPIVNPDGAFRGRTRTNAKGVDLNRAWADCGEANSPEVFCVRGRMMETGVDFFLDIHGEETLLHAFIVNADQVPSMTPARVLLRCRYEAALRSLNASFQSEKGYQDKPGERALLSSEGLV